VLGDAALPPGSLVVVVLTRWPAGHAERDGMGVAVAAHHRDGVLDPGSLGLVELGDIALDPIDQLSDPGDLLLGRSGVGARPLIEAVEGGGQVFPGVQQIIEIGLQVGQMRNRCPKMVAAGAAEPDGTSAAAGLHVRRFAAGAVGHGDFPDRVAGVLGVQQCVGVAPDPVTVPVEAQRGEGVDGGAATVFADAVVPACDIQIPVIK
jgi:hypothetical protein